VPGFQQFEKTVVEHPDDIYGTFCSLLYLDCCVYCAKHILFELDRHLSTNGNRMCCELALRKN
jgi:hypothetical protein